MRLCSAASCGPSPSRSASVSIATDRRTGPLTASTIATIAFCGLGRLTTIASISGPPVATVTRSPGWKVSSMPRAYASEAQAAVVHERRVGGEVARAGDRLAEEPALGLRRVRDEPPGRVVGLGAQD